MTLPNSMDSSGDNSHASRIAALHAECSELLRKLAWAILRDWGMADDAVQETFVLLAQKIATVEEEHQRGWLVKTVQFQSMNLRRNQQRSVQKIEQFREQNAAYAGHASQAEQERIAERVNELRQAIETLPNEQRQIVHMRLVEEKSFTVIASELKLPLGTVLSRMRLATEKLRRKLTDHESQ